MATYKVKTGENWELIGKRMGVDPFDLMEANPGVSNLTAGITIQLPEGDAPEPDSPPPADAGPVIPDAIKTLIGQRTPDTQVNVGMFDPRTQQQIQTADIPDAGEIQPDDQDVQNIIEGSRDLTAEEILAGERYHRGPEVSEEVRGLVSTGSPYGLRGELYQRILEDTEFEGSPFQTRQRATERALEEQWRIGDPWRIGADVSADIVRDYVISPYEQFMSGGEGLSPSEKRALLYSGYGEEVADVAEGNIIGTSVGPTLDALLGIGDSSLAPDEGGPDPSLLADPNDVRTTGGGIMEELAWYPLEDMTDEEVQDVVITNTDDIMSWAVSEGIYTQDGWDEEAINNLADWQKSILERLGILQFNDEGEWEPPEGGFGGGGGGGGFGGFGGFDFGTGGRFQNDRFISTPGLTRWSF